MMTVVATTEMGRGAADAGRRKRAAAVVIVVGVVVVVAVMGRRRIREAMHGTRMRMMMIV